MKNIKYYALFFLSLIASELPAQDALKVQLDSLEILKRKSAKAYDTNDYKEAIRYNSLLIDKAIQSDAYYYKFSGYNALGRIYRFLEDSVNAKVNAEKALEIAIASKTDSLISLAYLNLGNIYSENKTTYEKAILFYEKSLAINEKNKSNSEELYWININIVQTYLNLGKEDIAFDYLLNLEPHNDSIVISEEYKGYRKLLFGRYFLKKGYHSLAKRDLIRSAEIADKDSIAEIGHESYRLLAQVYSETGDYETAFTYLEKYNHYNQKIYAIEKLEEIEKASANFKLKEYQKVLKAAIKEKELSSELVSKSREVTTVFRVASGILCVALFGFFLLFKNRKRYVDRLRIKNLQLTDAKEKAEKLSKVKTQFFSTVSHELRTPLYGVIGISSILQDDKKLKGHEQNLKSLKFSADYLLALINDVLLLNKMDAESVEIESTPFQLDVLINNIMRSFEYSLEQNKNNLHVKIDKDIPNFLIGDSVRFSQILMNLIGNASKFNENGNIWLHINLERITTSGAYHTRFSIKDDGIGIPKNKQESIFEEFSQVENNNYSYQGTGLGLPIVKRLLELHKSKIHLKSEMGVGSEFSFSLDLIKDVDHNEKKLTEDITINDLDNLVLNHFRDKLILVVDDNTINQKITQKILKKHHFKSDVANDGEQAIAMVRAQEYSLILMDINMPRMNGIDASKVIRTFDLDTPIIALTAVNLDEMRHEILGSGMNDIILKPYDISQFLNTILKNLSYKENLIE